MYTNGNRVMSGAPQVVCFSSDAALVKISLIPSGSVDITVISSQVEIIDGTGDVFLCEIEITIRLMRKIWKSISYTLCYERYELVHFPPLWFENLASIISGSFWWFRFISLNIIAGCSRLRKSADIGAVPNAYKFICYKILNLTPNEAICVERRR